MQRSYWHHFKQTSVILLTLGAAAGWFYIIYKGRRANDPMEIVKKHFVFYPPYSHGTWRETECRNADTQKCREVTYTVPVTGCGPVTFDWRVSPGDDADSSWSYQGSSPKFDESKYPLYAVLNGDSRLIDSPALGKPLPPNCRSK